jgi:transcriptional regulator with XRE-family HTH domain
MSQVRAEPTSRAAVGTLLQHWRRARHLSQLALATEAGISPRHLCFLETGRAKPSRDMILLLATALDVPLRERNTLLLAAGFAPVYADRGLDAPELAAVRGALDAILHQQEPFPAVVMNRHWDIVATNRSAPRFFGFLLGAQGDRTGLRPAPPAEPSAVAPPHPPRLASLVEPEPQTNVLRMMLGPHGLRRYVTNWDAVAQMLVRRVHREAVGGVPDDRTAKLLAEILAYPGVAESSRRVDRDVPFVPVIPVTFQKADRVFSFFSTVTTLGTPQDITAQELRIECFFPADADTVRAARQLATEAS